MRRLAPYAALVAGLAGWALALLAADPPMTGAAAIFAAVVVAAVIALTWRHL